MSKIEFSKQQTAVMVNKLQSYFKEELDQEFGQFEAEFLLDFFAENIGAHFYNNGLTDAQDIIESKLLSIDEEIYAIKKDL